jgi:hypothetical protein
MTLLLVMAIFTSTTCIEGFETLCSFTTYFSIGFTPLFLNIFFLSLYFRRSMIFCHVSSQIWQEYFTSFYTLICWLITLKIIGTWSSFFFTLHVSTLWFILWQFVQYILVFLRTIWGYWVNIVLLLCGIDILLMAFTSKIPSSQTKVVSLCYYKVYFFTHVATHKYDCNPNLKK